MTAPTLQEQLAQAIAAWEKADADLKQADADLNQACADLKQTSLAGWSKPKPGAELDELEAEWAAAYDRWRKVVADWGNACAELYNIEALIEESKHE